MKDEKIKILYNRLEPQSVQDIPVFLRFTISIDVLYKILAK